jgi:hypothetical protein
LGYEYQDSLCSLSASIEIILNPNVFLERAVPFWVEFKACKGPCCSEIRSASVQAGGLLVSVKLPYEKKKEYKAR